MEKKIENLKDLFLQQGRELYEASKTEQNELPEIQKQANNPQLKKAIDRQIKSAKNQQNYLTTAFATFKEKPEGEKSECCQSIFKQTKNLINRSKGEHIRDAVIVNAVQRLNHGTITGLGSLAAYAKEIGQESIAKNLVEVLNEEKSIDSDLSNLAKKEINPKASISLIIK